MAWLAWGLFAGAWLLLMAYHFLVFYVARPLLFLFPLVLVLWIVGRRSRSWAVTTLVALGLTLPLWCCFPVRTALFLKARGPMLDIATTVDFPESVLILDERPENFRQRRLNMSYNSRVFDATLDGTRLKTLAVRREPWGKIRLYRVDAGFVAEKARQDAALAATEQCLALARKRLDQANARWQAELERLVDLRDRMRREQRNDHAAEAAGEIVRLLNRRQAATEPLVREVNTLRRRLREEQGDVHFRRGRHMGILRREAPSFDAPDQLPPMRYRARFTSRDRRLWEFWTLYRVEELHVHDNRTGKLVAWARSYRPFAPALFLFGRPDYDDLFLDEVPGSADLDGVLCEALFRYARNAGWWTRQWLP